MITEDIPILYFLIHIVAAGKVGELLENRQVLFCKAVIGADKVSIRVRRPCCKLETKMRPESFERGL